MAIEANVGSQIGPYIFIKKLGEGGLNEVWLAQHQLLGRLYAIKFLKRQFSDPLFATVLLHAETELVHPNIVRTWDIAEHNGSYYIVMDFVEGQDLEKVLDSRRGPLNLREAVDLSLQILDGLGFAHKHGLVHRDIKPSNILVSYEGLVKLTDFGMAIGTQKTRSVTTLSSQLDTPYYLSPEQIQNPIKMSAASDIYSFGCILYEMLTGSTPFDHSSGNETDFYIRQSHVLRPPDPPKKLRKEIPDHLNQLVLRCLEKDRERRPQSCEEISVELRAYMSQATFENSGRASQQIQPSFRSMPRVQTLGVNPQPLPLGSSPAALNLATPVSAFAPSSPNSTTIRVFFATDRMQSLNLMSNPRYGKRRSLTGKLHYGKCDISIPACHKIGKLEEASILRLEFRPNPDKHIILLKTFSLAERQFLEEVRLSVSKSVSRDAFVFVHGYNVSFEDAARRTGQLAYDLHFVGAPIFYSWPSNGKIADYLKDETNVVWSTPHFGNFLNLISQECGAERIHIIAHSMGNRAVCDALRLLSQTQIDQVKVNHLVLAAPDIDAETFQELASTLQKLSRRITLYESSKDKAIQMSKKIHGSRRAGEPLLLIDGVDTIDASSIDMDFLGHSYFSDNRFLLSDIHSILFRDEPPSGRFGLVEMLCAEGKYYSFKP